MALFLQESQTQEVLSVNSLSEAFEALMEMAVEHGNLTEALLTADYQVDKQQSALLAEGKVEDAKNAVVGFAKRAAGATKNFAVRVWNRIKDIARLVMRKLGEYLSRLKGIASGTTCSAPANIQEYINTLIRNAEKHLHAIQNATSGVKQDAPKEGAVDPSSEHKDIGLPVIQNLLASVSKMSASLESTATKMSAEAGRIEGGDGDAAKVASLRTGASYGRGVAANLTKAASVLGTAIGTAKHKKPGSVAIAGGSPTPAAA
jgi:hypothetical protein